MNKKQIIIFSSLIAAFVLATLLIVFIIPSFKNDNILSEHYNNKILQFEKENKTLESVDVAFIGDSITEGYDLKTYYPNINIVNRGIAGDTTSGVINRLKISLYDISPKVIVLCIGCNNLDSMMKDYETILNNIKQNLPQSKIIISSLYPTSLLFAERNEKILTLNEDLKALAKKHSLTYFDSHSLMVNEQTKEFNENYTNDGLHPNSAAYQVITQSLTPIIESLLNN